MKCKVVNAENAAVGDIELPGQFKEAVRPDLIQRVVLALQANRRQQYGADPMAGKKAAVRISKRRRDYRGSYGIGISRVPRKVVSRRGTRINWVGAFAPGTVGGRRAHPPKSGKEWVQKVNKKENRKAIRSAIAGTLNKEAVEARGHKVPKNWPFIVADEFESIGKTKKVIEGLNKLGFDAELKRSSKKTIRAGRGTMRGRKYAKRKGILFVVSQKCNLEKAAKNIPGAEVVEVKGLNAELLAPGAVPGRLALFTKAAVERMAKEKLFM
jgi:large subunit ribosomal protein L4e